MSLTSTYYNKQEEKFNTYRKVVWKSVSSNTDKQSNIL